MNNETRIIRDYTIPEALGGGKDGFPRKVALAPLTSEQELQAAKVGRNDVMKSQYAAAKLSIVELDGKPASQADGDVDRFWQKADPKLRSLLLQAYNKISSPTAEEEDDFFASEVVRV